MPAAHKLCSIEAKLDALIGATSDQAKSTGAQVKPPTQDEIDEKRLKELAPVIKELLDMLGKGVSRQSADEEVSRLRSRVSSCEDEPRPLLRVYHDHAGTKVPTTRRTQSKLMMGEALQRQARVWSYPRDLEHALHMHAHEQLEILQRVHASVGKKRKSGET
jgi:hypothetical protein